MCKHLTQLFHQHIIGLSKVVLVEGADLAFFKGLVQLLNASALHGIEKSLLGFRTSLLIRVGSPGFYQVFIR